MVRGAATVAFLLASAPVAAQDTAPPSPAEAPPRAAPPPPRAASPEVGPPEPDAAEFEGEEAPMTPAEEPPAPSATGPAPVEPVPAANSPMVELRPPDAYPAAEPVPPVRRPAAAAPPVAAVAPRPIPMQSYERRSPAMMVAGIVLTGVGAIGAVAGAALVGEAEKEANCARAFGSLDDTEGGCDPDLVDVDLRNAGIISGIGGLAFIAAGIPLTVVGARQVPTETAWRPRIRIGPTRAQLRWQF